MADHNKIPNDQKSQSEKLKSFEILDTKPEMEFDLITELAAEIFKAPVALISFFNEERVYIKSAVGFTSNSNLSFNNSLFKFSNAPLIIENLQEHKLTKDRKFYLKDQHILFYLSEPIITTDGFVIGNICVIDFEPKKVTESELNLFRNLVKLISEKLQNRIFIRNWIKLSDERVHMLIHDLKNPMTTLCLHSELIGKMAHDKEKVTNMSLKMNNQAKAVVNSMNEILSSSRTENSIVKMQKHKLDLCYLLKQVKNNLHDKLKQKSQSLTLNLNDEIHIYGDESRLILAFTQLIDNAIKFSKDGDEIQIDTKNGENNVIISIKDEGQGILNEELDRLFTKFADLSAIPSNYQQSNGLGLSIAKILIDLHKGKIWAESEGRDMGTVFYLELPTK